MSLSPQEQATLHNATVDTLVRLARNRGVLRDLELYRMLACNVLLAGAVLERLLTRNWADLEGDLLVLTPQGEWAANDVRQQLIGILLLN